MDDLGRSSYGKARRVGTAHQEFVVGSAHPTRLHEGDSRDMMAFCTVSRAKLP